MIKKLIFVATLFLFLSATKSPIKESGELFIVAGSSSGPDAKISLCLNGRAKISCQTYETTGYYLGIKTVIPNHTYPVAGIKILEGSVSIPTTNPPLCTPYSNGYCLFSVSDSTSANFILTSGQTMLPKIMPEGRSGEPYSLQFYVLGAYPPLYWEYLNTTSPEISNASNFTLNSSTGSFTSVGNIAINPGIYTLGLKATDSQIPSVSITKTYTFFINGSVVINPRQEFLGAYQKTQTPGIIFTIGNPATSTPGNTYTYEFSQTAGSLPAGLSLTSSCGGTPNAQCFTGSISSSAVYQNYTFQLKATQKLNGTATGVVGYATYTLTVVGDLVIGPVSNFLDSGQINTLYNENLFIANPGNATAPVSITNNSAFPPPDGISFGTTQSTTSPYITPISGTPTYIGLYNVGANAIDANSNNGSKIYQLIIEGDIEYSPTPTVDPLTALNSGTINQLYTDQTISAINVDSSAIIAWHVSDLPPGLSFTTSTDTHSITISGTPTSAGTFTPQVTAISSNTASKGFAVYSLNIIGSVSLTPPTATYTGTVGTAFTQTITCTPPSGSCTFSYTGQLPLGLTGTAGATTYTIAGTPSYSGKSSITLQASSTTGVPTSGVYAFNIASNITISPNVYSKSVGYKQKITQTVTISNFSGSLTSCSLTGSIPPNTTQSCNLKTGIFTITYYNKRTSIFGRSRTYKFQVQVVDEASNSAKSGIYSVKYCSLFSC